MPTTSPPDQIIMIILGVIVVIAALTLLRLRPPPTPPGTDRQSGDASQPPTNPLGLTEPTRLVISVVLLVIGYHLVMWSIPASWGSPIVVSRHRWYYLAAGALLVIAASLLLDLTGARGRRD